jgi:hypothetical protein
VTMWQKKRSDLRHISALFSSNTRIPLAVVLNKINVDRRLAVLLKKSQ